MDSLNKDYPADLEKMAEDAANTVNEDLNYEDAMQELEQIVARLERGDSDLDSSMKLFERGIALAQFCDRKLTQMEEKIKVLSVDAQGEATEEDFEPDFGFDL